MLILGRDKVFMLDRDNSVFHVKNLHFPKRKEVDKYLQKTLLDGVCFVDSQIHSSPLKSFFKGVCYGHKSRKRRKSTQVFGI